MSRRSVTTGLVVLAVLAGAAGAGAFAWARHRDDAAMRKAATDLTTAWRKGELTTVPFAGTNPGEAATKVQEITAQLTPERVDAPAKVSVASVTRSENDRSAATALLDVTWTVDGTATWSYQTTLALERRDGRWLPVWSPRLVHPRLGDTEVLDVARTPAPRGDILGSGDAVLVTAREVVYVGIQPNRADDPERAARRVAAVVDVDADALVKRVTAAKPGAFVDVITLRREHYDELRDDLRPIPGAVFREGRLHLAPDAGFARALLGTVGAPTKELVQASGGRIRVGDVTGLSGLQRSYDEYLGGKPGLTVRPVPRQGAPQEPQAQPLLEVEPTPGRTMKLTLDLRTQRAAEAALARATRPAALVAIRASTGEVLAVANGGPNATGYNRALHGQYPPGSTFKVVSTYALLRDGLKADETVVCPPRAVVNGKVFTNAENEVLGSVPFRSDFAHSCNTAFVGSADRITQQQLRSAAADLGYGTSTRSLGPPAFPGSVPDTDNPIEHAADVIGQGKVLASPLTVATVSASIAAGTPVAPQLVVEPKPGSAEGGTGAPDGTATGTEATATPTVESARADRLDSAAVATLRSLMREVVTGGTGTGLRGVPGGPVAGKTGTAEYGGGDPPRTHAWFTGFQEDLAFAVVVEDGGFGARTAAPVAADFLRRLS